MPCYLKMSNLDRFYKLNYRIIYFLQCSSFCFLKDEEYVLQEGEDSIRNLPSS